MALASDMESLYELSEMRWSRLLIGGYVALALSCARPAQADDYAGAVNRAAAARDRALETQRAQDWQEAFELFAAAVALRATPEATFELGESARQLGLEAQALQAFEDALALGLVGKAGDRAREFVAERAGAFGRLSVRGPDAARLYVDDAKRAVLPTERPIVLAPGPHRLHVESANQPAFEKVVTIVAGETVEIDVTPPPPARAPLPAHEAVKPPAPLASRDADSDSSWRTPVIVTSGGLVVAGVAAIVASSIAITNKRDELEKECAELRDGGDECASTTATHVTTAQSIGNDILALKGVRWAGVGAAVLGTGGVLFGLLGGRAKERPAQGRAAVTLGPETVGVTWRSSF